MNSTNTKTSKRYNLSESAENQLHEAERLTRGNTLLYPVDHYYRHYKKERLIIPEYQRGFKWNRDLQSALIESLLLEIPVGLIYLYRPEDYQLPEEIVDGSQRIRSIISFMDNEFPLQNLEILTEFNGLYMRDIGVDNVLLNRVLPCFLLSEEAKNTGFEKIIFKRVNNYQVIMSDEDYICGLYHNHPLVVTLLQENGRDRAKTLNNLKLLAGTVDRDQICNWLELNNSK